MLAHAIYSPKINFSQVASEILLGGLLFFSSTNIYGPVQGLDVLYHFQLFCDKQIGRRHRFRNALERFNFKHSSCRNMIERAFSVLK